MSKPNPFLHQKALSNARILHQQFPETPFQELYRMSYRLWTEARRMILEQASPAEWAVMKSKDKVTVCVAAIKTLTDGKTLQELLNR